MTAQSLRAQGLGFIRAIESLMPHNPSLARVVSGIRLPGDDDWCKASDLLKYSLLLE